MSNQVVILHGWSDTSESFKGLSSHLKESGFQTVPILLGDYISLRDDVTIEDVAKRMEEVISDRLALPASSPSRLGPKFHLVVHSTGGLVARRWISRYYMDRPCPVKNMLMLAPANFGSKLAHKGRSLLGRVVKGWRTGFETGEEMLYALELNSPFLWDLAEADLFQAPDAPDGAALYSPDKVRPFVIVGTHPYDDLATRLTNENGSDGTVRVAAANLNAVGVTVDFTGDPGRLEEPLFTPWERRGGDDAGEFPLAVLPDRDHGSVVRPAEPGYARDPEVQARLGELIVRALRVRTVDDYGRVAKDWSKITAETRNLAGLSKEAQRHRDHFFKKGGVGGQCFNEHFQVLVRAVDDFGAPVPDYFLAFMPQWKKRRAFGLGSRLPRESVFFHDEVLSDVHRHRREPANLCMYMDRYDLMRSGGFYAQISPSKLAELAFTVTAADPGDRVSYFSRSKSARRGLIPLHDKDTKEKRWLRRHTTHFMKVIIPRNAVPEVFRLRRG